VDRRKCATTTGIDQRRSREIRRMTQRTGFVLHVRPDRIGEYVEAHRHVWPEMLDALRGAGIRNYTIFRAGESVFGYFEADDLEAADRFLAAQEVSTRWQDAMAELLQERVPEGGPAPLEQIFRLD
jgi:L-rhamnose mutarotase